MNDLKVGIKIGNLSPMGYLEKIIDFIDFIEIYAHPDFDTDFILQFKKPVVIHIPHFANKINFANPERENTNIAFLNHAKKLADKFNSEKIIFHPELKEDDDCSIENIINFLNKNFDQRLLIENMPYSSEGFEHFGGTYEDLTIIMSRSNIGFCLDFNHAEAYAIRKNLNLKKFLDQLLSLKPSHFHISDVDFSQAFDFQFNEEHVNFEEGNATLNLYKKLIPKKSYITIETPQVAKKQIKEIQFLKE